MRFFDTHCDTVQRVIDGSFDFQTGKGTGHVSLPAMLTAGSCAQIFACFVLSERYPGKERQTAEAIINTIQKMVAGTNGQMQVALSASDLHAACEKGPIAALIGLEGADPLEGDAEALHHFYRLGVRDLILAWQDNPFSGTAFGTNTPLTPEGEKLVALAEELRVMVDVSHLSDVAFADVCRITTRPFIASHSNCRALCPSPRNPTDRMIRELADRGGVMGINLCPGFLEPRIYQKESACWEELSASGDSPVETRKKLGQVSTELPRPPIDSIIRHILHAIDIGGEDCVGIGGDLDGISSMPVGIEGIQDYPKIAQGLLDAGLRTAQVEKVCYRNFERVFCEVLTGET